MHRRRQPDEAYRLAWLWLARQPEGVHRDQLLFEVYRVAARMLGEPEPTAAPRHGYSSNCLITFEKLGLLLSEDKEGLVYAWIPERSTLSQT